MNGTVNMNDGHVIPFTDDQHQRMISIYQGGVSSRKISDIFGVSQQTVLRRLRTMGVKIRRQGNPEFLK